jgi:integrase
MRKGELLGIRWDAVDLTNGFIHLKQTKNGRARSLPINRTLRSVLMGLRTRIDVPWVFHDALGRRITDRFKPFEGAVKKAGLVNFHFHDLRHTFASWLVMAGVPLAAVSELLGHTSLAMTMRYAHLSPKHPTDAVRVLDRDNSLDNHMTIEGSECGEAQAALTA